MATAFYSLITNKVIKQDLAMTGELDLVGKVMPIGGLKEKVLAARRNKIETILIPKFNKRDLDELDQEIKKGLTFHPVSTFDEVLYHVFGEEKVSQGAST
jgi:ATP-dependent Lon protease